MTSLAELIGPRQVDRLVPDIFEHEVRWANGLTLFSMQLWTGIYQIATAWPASSKPSERKPYRLKRWDACNFRNLSGDMTALQKLPQPIPQHTPDRGLPREGMLRQGVRQISLAHRLSKQCSDDVFTMRRRQTEPG